MLVLLKDMLINDFRTCNMATKCLQYQDFLCFLRGKIVLKVCPVRSRNTFIFLMPAYVNHANFYFANDTNVASSASLNNEEYRCNYKIVKIRQVAFANKRIESEQMYKFLTKRERFCNLIGSIWIFVFSCMTQTKILTICTFVCMQPHQYKFLYWFN